MVGGIDVDAFVIHLPRARVMRPRAACVHSTEHHFIQQDICAPAQQLRAVIQGRTISRTPGGR